MSTAQPVGRVTGLADLRPEQLTGLPQLQVEASCPSQICDSSSPTSSGIRRSSSTQIPPATARSTRPREGSRHAGPGQSVDRCRSVQHPRHVLTFVRRLVALALTAFVGFGNVAVCAGWSPTAEARMACCADGISCPMHKGEHHGAGSKHTLTQAQADMCCAASERNDPSQSNPTSVAAVSIPALGAMVVLPAVVPASVLRDSWRRSAPVPLPPVPKHILLSVFLV